MQDPRASYDACHMYGDDYDDDDEDHAPLSGCTCAMQAALDKVHVRESGGQRPHTLTLLAPLPCELVARCVESLEPSMASLREVGHIGAWRGRNAIYEEEPHFEET